jgi:acyl phosphate:glycerol-3-phosphate acyltransferase
MLGRLALMVVVTALISYFLGCFNGALLISKYILKDDIRKHGSGNAGLTNFYRVFGGKLTILVVLCDMLKAVIAVLIGGALLGHFELAVVGKYLAGMCCLLGHMFPCMFQFKGGKGILSGGAVVLMMDWRIAAVVWGVFIVLFAVSKMVSLGSLCGGAAFPIMSAIIYRSWLITAMAIVIGVLIFWRHRSNIIRILKGEENTFHLHHKDENHSEN